MEDNNKYRGMRALLLTRVSTPEQEKMYGHIWQEMEIRKKLIEPLGLRLNEARHIIRDTYSGLDFKSREALIRILEMAERGEFDVLCMEVLDRGLGRKALAREIYRMQLRELGVRVLTTDPNDHADDDSLIGEMIRMWKGHKAEEEIVDFVRRTMGGKHAKVEGMQKDGTIGQKKLIGCGSDLYGYAYTLSAQGRNEMYILNLEVIFIDSDGGIWTEIAVVGVMFAFAEIGITIRRIARFLNEKGIPSPRGKRWSKTTVGRMLRNTAYKGEHAAFATRGLPKVRGRRTAPRVPTSPEEQVIVPIPAIIREEQFAAVQTRLVKNKQRATRNAQHPYKGLLRGGLARCAQCGATLYIQVRRGRYAGKTGTDVDEIRYQCTNYGGTGGPCKGCSISARMLDEVAWQKAIEIMRDPTKTEQKIRAALAEVKSGAQRAKAVKQVEEIRRRQQALRKDLSRLSQEEKLDKGTQEHLLGDLHRLSIREEEAQRELDDAQLLQEKYQKLEQRIVEFYEKCTQWRAKIDDPEFITSYDFKRDACEFFGITAIVRKSDQHPRYEITDGPPHIMSLIS
jgi:site-specific DNA recombinase